MAGLVRLVPAIRALLAVAAWISGISGKLAEAMLQ
jgi:hypothetical protein